MKRWAARILVFVLLLAGGAIVSIAVAWGFGARVRSMSAPSPVALAPEELAALWDEYGPLEFGLASTNRTLTGWRDTGPVTTTKWFGNNLPTYGVINSGGLSMDILLVESGFPCRCLKNDERRGIYVMLASLNGLRRSDNWLDECDVLWPGFVINTVFYAVIVWGLFAAPFALRRRRRIKRGLCPKCAYDLRGHVGSADATACPECGEPR